MSKTLQTKKPGPSPLRGTGVVRFETTLFPEQVEVLDLVAREKGISRAALVRQIISTWQDRLEPPDF